MHKTKWKLLLSEENKDIATCVWKISNCLTKLVLVYLCYVLLDLTSVIFAMFFKLESLCTHVGLNLWVQFNDLVS